MGASASSTVSKINNEVIEGAYQNCPSIGSMNVANFEDVNFYPGDWCGPDAEFVVGQQAEVDASCVLNAMQKSASQIAANLSAEARTGFGLSAASDVSSVTNSMKNLISNKCEDASSSNIVNFKDVDVTACKFRVVQKATAKTVCETNATQDLTSSIAVKAAADSTGFLGGLFSGGLTTIIVVIVILFLLIGGGGAIFYFMKDKGGGDKSKEAKGGAFAQSQTGTIIIIVLFILIIMLLLSPCMANKPPLNQDDLNRWNNMAKETQSMAGLSESSTTENDVFYDQYQNTSDVYSNRQDMLEANASLDKYFNNKLY